MFCWFYCFLFDIKYYSIFIERQQAFKYIYYIYSNRTSVTVTFFFFLSFFFSHKSLVIQLGFQLIFAIIVYLFIVQRRGTTLSYLIGYGIVIPLTLLYIPFELLEYLVIYNCTIKLAFTTLPTIVCFRTIEAMHNTSPSVVESSLGSYMIYYSTVSHFEWDNKTNKRKPITSTEIVSSALRILYFYIVTSLFLSFMIHVNYQLVPSSIELDSFNLSWDMLSWNHLVNTYCLAVLTYFVLALAFELVAFGEQVKGYSIKPIFNNPLWSSRSIREFWSRKWDLMIQRVLKYGAYLPTKKVVTGLLGVNNNNKNMSNVIGTIGAFLASGLLHEYCWIVIFYRYQEQQPQQAIDDEESLMVVFTPSFFKLTLFFLYNCGVMLLEDNYGKYVTFFEKWPCFVVSTMIVMIALPISHWFTGDWVVGGYFSDFAMGLWQIRKL